MAKEIDLVAAVRSPDTSDVYGEALAQDGVFWSVAQDCWVAVRPEDIEAVLVSAQCVVRPPGEAVPVALAGTSLGGVFSRLARMIDGEQHGAVRRAVEEALGTLELDAVAETCAGQAGGFWWKGISTGF